MTDKYSTLGQTNIPTWGIKDKESFSVLRNILPRHSKKIAHLQFCVFQTKSNKGVGSNYAIKHDKELKSNLRKSPKLSSYLALHPGNNKQNVPLALETTTEKIPN